MSGYTYDEFRLVLTPGADGAFDVRARGPSGREDVGVFRSPVGATELERAIVRLARGASRKALTRDAEPAAAEPVEFDAEQLGAALADALLAAEVGRQYQAARRDSASRGRGLRLTLSLAQAPELMSVPWELLYLRPRFLANQRRSPLVRHLQVDALPAPPVIDQKVSVLGVIANPSTLAPLDVEAERARVAQAVAKVEAMGRLEVDWLDPATPRGLREALRDGHYDILHFVGHSDFTADGSGVLYLEDEDGGGVAVDETELANLLSDQDGLRLVVLNSCEGARTTLTDPFAGVATTLIQLGIPAVIAMQFEISDAAAILFAEELYTNLIGRQTPIDTAVAEARKAIYIEMRNLEWATPVLYMGDTNVELFRFELPAAPLPPPRASAEEATGEPPAAEPPPPVAVAAAARGDDSTVAAEAPRRSSRRVLAAVSGAALVVVVGVVVWLVSRSGDDDAARPPIEVGPPPVLEPTEGPAGTIIDVRGEACPPAPEGFTNGGVAIWLKYPDSGDHDEANEYILGPTHEPWQAQVVVPADIPAGDLLVVGAACWLEDAAENSPGNYVESEQAPFQVTGG